MTGNESSFEALQSSLGAAQDRLAVQIEELRKAERSLLGTIQAHDSARIAEATHIEQVMERAAVRAEREVRPIQDALLSRSNLVQTEAALEVSRESARASRITATATAVLAMATVGDRFGQEDGPLTELEAAVDEVDQVHVAQLAGTQSVEGRQCCQGGGAGPVGRERGFADLLGIRGKRVAQFIASGADAGDRIDEQDLAGLEQREDGAEPCAHQPTWVDGVSCKLLIRESGGLFRNPDKHSRIHRGVAYTRWAGTTATAGNLCLSEPTALGTP